MRKTQALQFSEMLGTAYPTQCNMTEDLICQQRSSENLKPLYCYKFVRMCTNQPYTQEILL